MLNNYKNKSNLFFGLLIVIAFALITSITKQPKDINIIKHNFYDNDQFNHKIDLFADSLFIAKYPQVIISLNNSFNKIQEKNNIRYSIKINKTRLNESYNDQYFEIVIFENEIEIKSEYEQGLLNGIIRLEKESRKSSSKLFNQTITDYSNISRRLFHIGLRGNEDLKIVKEIIYNSRNAYLNELVLMIRSGVGFKSLKPELTRKWKYEDLNELIQYSNELGIKVIPEIKLLTHQEKLFKNSYPHLMFNKTTYNPDDNRTYEVVFPLIDEIIDIFQCDTFHIGHDEVAGYRKDKNEKYIKSGEVGITPKQYLRDVIKLHDYLKSKGIKTMMWADMLLDRGEFKEMNRSGMHGGNGFKNIIDDLPKDIIMGNWHYFQKSKNYPTYDYLINKGFNVYGAIWKDSVTNKNFTSYINNSNFNNKAIMATAWGNINSKSNEMTEILMKAGNLIWELK
jgi:hypothetical protein